MKFLLLSLIGIFLSINTFSQKHDNYSKSILKIIKSGKALPVDQQYNLRTNQVYKEKLDRLVIEDYEEQYKSRIRFFYNENWQVITAEIDVLNFITRKWFTEAKIEFTYNPGGQLIQMLETWKDDVNTPWYNAIKTNITYNSSGYQADEIDYFWDETENVWTERYKSTFEYSTEGYIVKTIDYEWDNDLQSWDQTDYTIWSMDSNNRISQLDYYNWNFFLDQWELSQYTTFEYDGQNNVIQEDNYFKSGDTMEFTDLYEYLYDYSVLYSELATLPSEEFVTQGKTENKLISFDFKASYYDWNTVYRETFYYSSIDATGTFDINMETPGLFPNPATDRVTIKNSNTNFSENGQFEVYDINGIKVISGKYSNSQFSVSDLKKGIYQVKISDNHQTFSERILVK